MEEAWASFPNFEELGIDVIIYDIGVIIWWGSSLCLDFFFFFHESDQKQNNPNYYFPFLSDIYQL